MSTIFCLVKVSVTFSSAEANADTNTTANAAKIFHHLSSTLSPSVCLTISSSVCSIMSQLPNPHTGKPYSPAYHVMRLRAAELPVSGCMPVLLQAIRNNSVTIIVGETGSGKSTQLPKRILESMRASGVFGGDICLTQPRRLAAESVSLDTHYRFLSPREKSSLTMYKHRSPSASPGKWRCR
jgi:hypothetical protein